MYLVFDDFEILRTTFLWFISTKHRKQRLSYIPLNVCAAFIGE